MVISLTVVFAILASILAWLLIVAAVCLLLFGNDSAFIIGPVLATVVVAGFWLVHFGVIRFQL